MTNPIETFGSGWTVRLPAQKRVREREAARRASRITGYVPLPGELEYVK